MYRRIARDNRNNGTSLLINKEDCSDKEIENEQYETEEENVSVAPEDYQPDNQDKNDGTALDDKRNQTTDPTKMMACSVMRNMRDSCLYKTYSLI